MLTRSKPPSKLLPGGQSIGVSFQSKGVMVIRKVPVINENFVKCFPAKEAKIYPGDVILKIDGMEVNCDRDVEELLNRAANTVGFAKMLVERRNEVIELIIKPVFEPTTGLYKGGLRVLNKITEIGTLTFIDSTTDRYGAFGHAVHMFNLNKFVNACVVASFIDKIKLPVQNCPGKKIGSFIYDSSFKGTIDRNTKYGIFGRATDYLPNPFFKDPIDVADENEVQPGPAKIYTVINGENIEEFEIMINSVVYKRRGTQDLAIQIVDEKLINKTGGIVQGMSGSPIVQNNKLVGAISYLYMDDSKRGYGVSITKMLRELGGSKQKIISFAGLFNYVHMPVFGYAKQ